MFGNLYLSESERGHFTADDEELATSLAVTAVAAIDNARLYEAACAGSPSGDGHGRYRPPALPADAAFRRIHLQNPCLHPLGERANGP